MAVTNIVQRLMTFIQTKIAHPFAMIPAIMIICSTIKRPGLSSLQISARILNKFGDEGLLIGTNIDGSENNTNKAVYIIVDEIVKAIKLDSKVLVGLTAGAVKVSVPGVGVCPSINNVEGSGIMI